MRRTALMMLVASGCVAGGGSVANAADDVGVYVGNPRVAKYIEAATLLRQQLPGARERWNAVAATGATFTLAFLPGLNGHPTRSLCEGVPIRVTVTHGQVASAVYAASAATCRAGAAVTAVDDPYLHSLVTPAALFQEVASQLERGVQGNACVDAYFDPDFGLPTTLNEGCPWMKDAGLRIQISDIVSTRQRTWNLAVTAAGSLLVLLGLAYYHYKRLRRRREAMPELLLR